MAAIRESYHQGGRPTVREIATAIGEERSNGNIYYNLRILDARGLIRLHKGTTRGIELVLKPGDPCPACGQAVEITTREQALLRRARQLLQAARPGPDALPPRGAAATLWNEDVDNWIRDDRDG